MNSERTPPSRDSVQDCRFRRGICKRLQHFSRSCFASLSLRIPVHLTSIRAPYNCSGGSGRSRCVHPEKQQVLSSTAYTALGEGRPRIQAGAVGHKWGKDAEQSSWSVRSSFRGQPPSPPQSSRVFIDESDDCIRDPIGRRFLWGHSAGPAEALSIYLALIYKVCGVHVCTSRCAAVAISLHRRYVPACFVRSHPRP